MILVDTSVWIDHLRSGIPELARLLDAGQILIHPFVIGEIALGSLRNRAHIIGTLQGLPKATLATSSDVLSSIERSAFYGLGIGYVDAHLICATRLSPPFGSSLTKLWTRDKRLRVLAELLGIAFVAKPE